MRRKGWHGLFGMGVIAYLAMGLAAGCGTGARQAITIEQEPYEKLSYQTTEAKRGDLNSSITLTLVPEGYERIEYYAENSDLKLEKVYVSVGDRVKKGDILVAFESEQIRETMADYKERKSQNELLVEHYEKLMQIDTAADYHADIEMLKEDIHVSELYIEEAEQELLGYQIIAQEDGVITEISDYLQNGSIVTGKVLLSEVCGTGNYSVATRDADVFVVGESYTAAAGMTEYELRLLDITEETLTFEPVSDMSMVSGGETLTLTVEKPKLTDVVYVDKNAVCTIHGEEDGEDTYCVYVMKENGYQRAVPVTIGEQMNGNIVITQGLDGGEKVVIR